MTVRETAACSMCAYTGLYSCPGRDGYYNLNIWTCPFCGRHFKPETLAEDYHLETYPPPIPSLLKTLGAVTVLALCATGAVVLAGMAVLHIARFYAEP